MSPRPWLACVVVLTTALSFAACTLPEGSDYGAPCETSADCDDGYLCWREGCVPSSFAVVDAGARHDAGPLPDAGAGTEDAGLHDAGQGDAGTADAGPDPVLDGGDDADGGPVDGGLDPVLDGGDDVDAGAVDGGLNDAGAKLDAGEDAGDDGGLNDDAGPAGTCGVPTTAAIGFTAGQTSGLPNLLSTPSCGFFGEAGEGSEQVFVLTVPGSHVGRLSATVDSAADLSVYVRTACDDASSERACAESKPAGQLETLSTTAYGGELLYIVVDGQDADDAGAFTLSLNYTESVCGNGNLEAGEECDDDDVDTADGCDDLCRIEACLAPPAAALGPNEGDTSLGTDFLDGPFCVPSAKPEQVWSFVAPGSSDKGGRLYLTLSAATDQAMYVRPLDGCTSTTSLGCAGSQPGGTDETLVVPLFGGDELAIVVEPEAVGGEGPYTLTLDHVPAVCGNGDLEPGEECDDNNVESDDGCDIECREEPDIICANATDAIPGDGGVTIIEGDNSGPLDVFEGECQQGGSPEQVIRYAAPGPGTLYGALTATADLGFYVREVCEAPAELMCIDRRGTNGTEVGRLFTDGAQDLYFFVDGFSNDASAFTLTLEHIAIECGNTHLDPSEDCDPGLISVAGCTDCVADATEVEDNGTAAQANTYAAPFIGVIDSVSDVDFIAIDVGDTATLNASVTDFSNGVACSSGLQMAAEIALFGPDGTTLLASNRNANGFCGAIEKRQLADGTYYLRVRNHTATNLQPPGVFAYRLDVSVRLPTCGDGFFDPSEQCELAADALGDGGVIDADGGDGGAIFGLCTADCLLDTLDEVEPNDDGSPSSGTFAQKGNDFSTDGAEGPFSGDVAIVAAISPIGDEDIFAVHNPGVDAALVNASTMGNDGPAVNCPTTGQDTVIALRTADGSLLDYDDEGGAGSCSSLDFSIPPGETLYLSVLDYGDNSVIEDYILLIDFLP